MLSNFRFSRGFASRVLEISAVIAIIFVAGCGSTPAKPTVSVAITPAGPVTMEQGGTASLTAAVTNDTASAGVTWSLTGAGSLTGNTTTAVTYNAPASVTAAGVATVTATSVADTTKTAKFTVNLVPPPSITPATLPGGNVGTPYSQSVSVTGGVAPYTLSINGTQITGVTFTAGATSATLSGIPTTAATYSFTVKVTDSGNPVQSSSVLYSNVVIGAQLPLSITTSSLANGTLNAAYGPVSIGATGGFAPYSFSATGLPAGMTLSSGGSLTGTPTAAGSFSVVIKVTDSETPTAGTFTTTLPLTITAPPLALAPGSGNLPNATQNATYTASLTPSGGVGPYSIALDGTSAAMPAGLTFNPTTASTAAATITGTPTALGTTSGIIVDVTDSESPAVTTQFTYSLTVVVPCGSGSESLLSGQYAFVLSGFDGTGNPALIGGVLTASGASGSSNLTAGAVDMNLSGGVQSNLAIAAGSNYTVGSDGRGCMSIVTTAGTQNYRFSLGSSGNGHMIDFDATGPFTTGVLRKQTISAFSTAQISGNYAFGVSAPQDTSGSKLAAMGALNLDGKGSVTSGSADYNYYNGGTSTVTLDGSTTITAWPTMPETVNSGGTYTIGSNGRGTLAFALSDGSVIDADIYVVSANEVLMASSGTRSSSVAIFAGTAFKQSSTSYTSSSLTGSAVLYNSSTSSNGSGTPNSNVSIGIVTFTGGNNFSYSGYSNGGGNVQGPSNNSATGTFSVTSNGRVTLTVGGGGGGGNNQLPEFYLYAPSSAFAVFSGSGASDGRFESQTTTSAANGTYTTGSIDPQTAGVTDKSGVVTLSSPNATATDDSNSQGTLSPNSAGANTYSVDSNGVFFLPASCTPGTNCERIGTVITGSKIITMDANSSSTQGGTSNPGLQVLDQ
jgi:large repetitive protein